MSFLSDLFGGGSARKAAQAAEEQEREATERALGLLSPFQQAGVGAIGNLQGLLGQDPTDIINKILSQYQESPEQQFRSKEAKEAMQNQLAAAGLSGSGEAIQRSGQLAQQLAGQGQEQYLQDVLGQRQQQMGGLENLFRGGLSAAGTGSGLLGQEGQALGGLEAAGIMGQGQERANLLKGLGQLFGSAIGAFGGGGGMSGLGSLFGGSQWTNPDTGLPFQAGGFAPQFGF